MISFLVLFMNFYIQTYVFRKKKPIMNGKATANGKPIMDGNGNVTNGSVKKDS